MEKVLDRDGRFLWKDFFHLGLARKYGKPEETLGQIKLQRNLDYWYTKEFKWQTNANKKIRANGTISRPRPPKVQRFGTVP